MWFLQPKEDYVSQMPWKHADEPAVMSWQIRARNYNTFVANLILLIWMVVFGGFLLALGWSADASFSDFKSLALIALFLIVLPITMSMTHQTTIIVYRFTEKGAEVYSWKPQIDSVKPVLKWLSIILLPIVGVIILMDPGLAVTAIGPLGIGLMAWMMGSSKEYQETQRDTQHYELDWRETNKIYLYPRREIIGLNIPWYDPDTRKVMPKGIRPVYCHEKDLDKCVEFFRKKLPKIECVEEKFIL